MGGLLELVRMVLERGANPVAEIDGHSILVVEAVGQRGDLTVYVHAREDDDQLVVYAVHPDRASEDVRATMSEFFTRANWALAVGNFELDLDDGEMRFKVGIDAEGDKLRPSMVAQMLRTAIAALDTFTTGIARVLAGEQDTSQILSDLADE
jgi:hypothetical protein